MSTFDILPNYLSECCAKYLYRTIIECFSLIKTKKQIKYRKGNLDLADPSEVHDERCVSQWNAFLYN